MFQHALFFTGKYALVKYNSLQLRHFDHSSFCLNNHHHNGSIGRFNFKTLKQSSGNHTKSNNFAKHLSLQLIKIFFIHEIKSNKKTRTTLQLMSELIYK